MSDNFQIRRMQIDDIPLILELENDLFSSPWSGEMFLEEIRIGYAYVLASPAETCIIAYICGLLLYDEFNITNLAVARAHQKKGYGQAMISFMIDNLRRNNCYKFFLEVRETNLPAIRLYEKFGFKIAGKRRKYYSHPQEDAVMMELNISAGQSA